MHSSLPQQLSNFEFTNSRFLTWIFEKLEKWVLKNSVSVITICPDLYDHVERVCPEKGSVLIENVIDYGMIFGEQNRSTQIRKELKLDGRQVALYTGTFEPYQGLDLLIEAAPLVQDDNPEILFLLVGGSTAQVEEYQIKVEKAGLSELFRFTGQVRPNEVSGYISCADLLLSPRISGTNTPLKIYAYLRSGVPIVATRLHTHTQVLNDSVAMLTDPDPEGFGGGVCRLLADKEHSTRLGKAAAELAMSQFSYKAYQAKLSRALKPVAKGRV